MMNHLFTGCRATGLPPLWPRHAPHRSNQTGQRAGTPAIDRGIACRRSRADRYSSCPCDTERVTWLVAGGCSAATAVVGQTLHAWRSR
jgi:hypothetical protein